MTLGGESLSLAVASAARGDREALTTVLEAIRPMVVGHCRAKLSGLLGNDGADEVAEDVCTAILTGLPARGDSDEPFLSYVYGITVRKVEVAQAKAHGGNVTSLSERRAKKAGRDDEAFGGSVAEPHVDEGDAGRRMRQLLSALPQREREILILRLINGLSAEDTASALGCTPGVVRLDQHRAMKKLRELIASRGRVPR